MNAEGRQGGATSTSDNDGRIHFARPRKAPVGQPKNEGMVDQKLSQLYPNREPLPDHLGIRNSAARKQTRQTDTTRAPSETRGRDGVQALSSSENENSPDSMLGLDPRLL